PLHLSEESEPEPDLAVVQGEPRDHVSADHPRSALLIVEVSDTSLRYDRTRKAALYAGSGIDDYWIINLIDRQLDVHRERVADDTQAHGFRYGSTRVYRSGDSIAPLAKANATIAVADL